MKNKLLALAFVLSSCVVLFPSSSYAANVNAVSTPQIRVTIGRRHRHDRGLHRGWYRGRRIGWYNYDRHDPQYVRQVYWINGRRYTRWVRNY